MNILYYVMAELKDGISQAETLEEIVEPEKPEKPEYTPKQQRKYICLYISDLTFDETECVYLYLSGVVDKDMFCVHGSGCSINIDNISDNIISQVYNLVWEKQHE